MGASPAYLDGSDIDAIRSGNYLFARKIDPSISSLLLQELRKDSISAHNGQYHTQLL